MLLQRPPAGGEDQKLICNFELYYMQFKAVKDDIIEAEDSRSAKEYFGQFGTCLVGVQFLVRIFSNIAFARLLNLSS